MKNNHDYFSWHYVYAPKKILQIGSNYLLFFEHYFSAGLLFQTLFSPWKRLAVKKKPGFSFENFFYVLSFNLISRSVGAVARTILILSWAVIEIAIIVLLPIVFLAWFFLPGFTFVPYLLLRKETSLKFKIEREKPKNPQTLFSIFANDQMGKFVFKRTLLDKKVIDSLQTASQKDSSSFEIKNQNSSARIFYQLAQKWPPFKKVLSDHNLVPKDILILARWYRREKKAKDKAARFWERENLMSVKAIGKDWAYGFTPNLDRFCDDLARTFPFSHHLVGREKTARQIKQVLARLEDNNVILVGEPGVGRHTIIMDFAKRAKEGKIGITLSYKKVLQLSLNQVLAESKSNMAAKGMVEDILDEAADAGNIILVIDNFDQYVSSGSGRINLSGAFSQALNKGVQIIGITNFQNYAQYLETNPEVAKKFQKVEALPPTVEEAMIILQDTLALYENRSQVFVTYQALKDIIEKVDRYVINIPFPEKAVDLLDEACIYAEQGGVKVVTPELVDEVISEKSKIPIGDIQKTEAEKLTNLEGVIHQRIINQKKAVEAIARAVRRARVGISVHAKPIGSFLFMGPTGVGKTETAKALAEGYFGSEKRIIRFDMGEYQSRDSIDRVIGSSRLKEPGIFAKSIRENPFSLLLLDEIEKAHREILNLFLTMIDEGYFTDAFGRKVDCRNLIIIGTSNAGTEMIRQKLQSPTATFDHDALEKEVVDYVQREKIFSPEFINRFDAVIIYRPLAHEHLVQIAELMLKKLNRRLEKKKLSVKITPELLKRVAELGYDPALGARPMNRVIQDKIEDQLAKMILKGEVKRGDEVEVRI